MVLPQTVEDYARLIEEKTPFAQANYGDGEWACLLGHDGVNCQGEVYNDLLALRLRKTLTDHTGMWLGSNPGKKLIDETNIFLDDYDLRGLPWVWKEILPSANVNGQLAPFLRAVRTRKVILVGPLHLASMSEMVIGPFYHFPVPDEVAWKVAERTMRQLTSRIEREDLVLFASGMGTNLVIHEMWPEVEAIWGTSRGDVSFLDVGALLDPYVGRFSRNGYRKEIFQRENIHRNLL